jgi:iron-sulfur cluster insertion protein
VCSSDLESAISRIVDLLIEENNPNVKLRTFVQGGGCSGFQYGFTFDEDQNEDDFVLEHPGMVLLVDSISMQYLEGATIDYKEELMGSSFVVNNPHAQSTCGCGSSFSM